MRRHHKIAVEPLAFRLLRTQQKNMIRDPPNLLRGKLVVQKQIKKLMRCNYDLNFVALGFFKRNLIHQKLRVTTRRTEAGTK